MMSKLKSKACQSSKQDKNLLTPYSSEESKPKILNDSGYFTPSPALLEGGKDDKIEPELEDKRRQRVINRQNLEQKFQTDRIYTIDEKSQSGEREIKQTDVISQLGEYRMFDISSKILTRLNGKDLTRFCCVCKSWRDVCLRDDKANQRRKKYLEKKRINIENNGSKPELAAKGGALRQPFCSISNTNPQLEVIPEVKKEQKYFELVKTLESHEIMDKCPNCGAPARLNRRTKVSRCTHASCMYEYCSLCRCPYASSHHCSPVKLRMSSKTSSNRSTKWSLNRLLL